jgi:hypothetical protein
MNVHQRSKTTYTKNKFQPMTVPSKLFLFWGDFQTPCVYMTSIFVLFILKYSYIHNFKYKSVIFLSFHQQNCFAITYEK